MANMSVSAAWAQEKDSYTMADAYEVLRCALHVSDNGQYDIDGDGMVTLADAQCCLRYVLGIRNTEDMDDEQPGEDIPQTPRPESGEDVLPSSEPQPGEDVPPVNKPEEPDATTAPPFPSDTPYLSTEQVTLYTGSDATGSACAEVTLYNVPHPEEVECEVVCFWNQNEGETIWHDQGMESNSFWCIPLDILKTVPMVVSGDSVTYQIALSDRLYEHGWNNEVSGIGGICFTTSSDDTEYVVTVTIQRNDTVTTYYSIMDEDFINVGMVDENAVFSDAAVCTTDAALVLNNCHKGYADSDIVQDGTTWVSGPCVISTRETDAEKHYTVNHVKEITEVYLETQGEYDEAMTKAVEAELKKHTRWYWGGSVTDIAPQAYYDFLFDTIDSWYKGEISYRYMWNTLAYTKFYEGNQPENSADILEGARPQYFVLSGFANNGRGQDCKIYPINGTINIDTIWNTLHEMSGGWGIDDTRAGYVRVHYDSETDISYIYYIS